MLARSNLDPAAIQNGLDELLDSGQLIKLERAQTNLEQAEDLVISEQLWSQIQERAIQVTEKYHRMYPLRAGLPKEELKSRLKDLTQNSARLFNAILRKLVAGQELMENGPLAQRPGHTIQFTPQQQSRIQALFKRIEAAPYAPPSLKECQAEVGEDVLAALIDLGRLVMVAPEVVFRREDYQSMVEATRRLLRQNGTITVAQARDHFNTSRKYILAFLEHLDAIGVTLRDGDVRRLKT